MVEICTSRMTVINCWNEGSELGRWIKSKCQFKTLGLPCREDQRQKPKAEGRSPYGNEASDLHVTLHQSSCWVANGIANTELGHEEE